MSGGPFIGRGGNESHAEKMRARNAILKHAARLRISVIANAASSHRPVDWQERENEKFVGTRVRSRDQRDFYYGVYAPNFIRELVSYRRSGGIRFR